MKTETSTIEKFIFSTSNGTKFMVKDESDLEIFTIGQLQGWSDDVLIDKNCFGEFVGNLIAVCHQKGIAIPTINGDK